MRKGKKALALMMAAAMAFGLGTAAGCSSKTETAGTTPTAAASTQAATAAPAESKTEAKTEAQTSGGVPATEVKGTGETLIIYSNSVSDGRGDWLKERAAKDGFKIEYVDGGGGEIENRLVAEQNNPIADVVYGMNTMQYENLKKLDLLEKYVPVWADEVTPGLNDKDGYYHAIVKQAIFLIYNSEMYNEETAPKDWLDLWNKEEFRGKYESQIKLSGGTTRNVLAGVLVRYTDPNGELGISQEGWDEVAKYFEYGTSAIEGTEFYSRLASGETPFGQMWSSGIAAREEQYGVKAGIVNPEVGVPYAVEQVAVVKGTKHLEEAKRFVDWFGSAQIQGEWTQQFSTIPANEKSLPMASEENQKISNTYKPQDIDWAFVAENINAWMEKCELEYMK